MASAELSRRVEKVVGYPPLSKLSDLQRREFHEALLEPAALRICLGSGSRRSWRRNRSGRRCASSRATSSLGRRRVRSFALLAASLCRGGLRGATVAATPAPAEGVVRRRRQGLADHHRAPTAGSRVERDIGRKRLGDQLHIDLARRFDPQAECLSQIRTLERRDIDRHARVLSVRTTVSYGEVVELGKTTRSRRQVPLSGRALSALDAIPPRLDTPLLFPAVRGGLLNLDNWRRREWAPAIEAAGIGKPARIYDLRSTSRLTRSPLACPCSSSPGSWTSTHMIERSYGALLDGAGAGIASRLDAFDQETDDAGREAGHQ